MIEETNNNKLQNQFKKKGWIKIEKIFPQKEIKNINQKVENFLNKNFKKYNDRYINFTNQKKAFNDINSFHKLDDCLEIKRLSKKKIIEKIVKNLLDLKKIKLRQSEFFAKPKKKGLPVPDHQDNFYWNIVKGNALTIWIALSKSNNINGAIHYYEGSHKYGILKHTPSYSKGTSQKIKNQKFLKKFKKVTPHLNKGDVLIHHSLIVHGSKPNKSNMPRKGITFQFIDKNAKLDQRNLKKYENSLYKQIDKRK